MSEYPNMNEVQRRTARLMHFQDGMWDLLLGTVFLALAFYPLTRAALGPDWNIGLFIGLVLLLAAAWIVVHRRIVTPRLGYAVPRRSPALQALLAVQIGLFLLTVGLVILTRLSPGWLGGPSVDAAPSWIQAHLMELAVLLFLVALFSVMGILFGTRRLFAYGWLIGGANLASVIVYNGTPDGFNLPVGIAAGAVLLLGAILLVRFIRAYPVQSPES
jgi:hypothetical protein